MTLNKLFLWRKGDRRQIGVGSRERGKTGIVDNG